MYLVVICILLHTYQSLLLCSIVMCLSSMKKTQAQSLALYAFCTWKKRVKILLIKEAFLLATDLMETITEIYDCL